MSTSLVRVGGAPVTWASGPHVCSVPSVLPDRSAAGSACALATGRPARENALSAVVGVGVMPGAAPAATLPDAPAPTRASRAPLGAAVVPVLLDGAVAAATVDGAR